MTRQLCVSPDKENSAGIYSINPTLSGAQQRILAIYLKLPTKFTIFVEPILALAVLVRGM